ncbi:MAG: hypothetical protein L6Q76_15990 [Polyangiaceae bacterium]|nr:hypothetical protein [Polyangiaceae bacterium]
MKALVPPAVEEDTSVEEPAPSEPSEPEAPSPTSLDALGLLQEEGALSEDAAATGVSEEALVDQLAARVRADPSDHESVLELADVLERLGRHLDLLALLSARMEEGGEAVRRELSPRRRRVLEALAFQARAEGKASEAELYEMMAAAEGE